MSVITAHRDHVQLKADRVFYKPINIQALVKYLSLFRCCEKNRTDPDADKGK